jgi:predicted PurR-regulated permease PerM
LFWWFVWGTAGALLGVPIMVAFRIFCERVEGLKGIAALMGGSEGTKNPPRPHPAPAPPAAE